MPIQTTVCPSCFTVRDVLLPRTDSPLPKCTSGVPGGDCGAQTDRMVSAPAFHLKGTGWYSPGASR